MTSGDREEGAPRLETPPLLLEAEGAGAMRRGALVFLGTIFVVSAVMLQVDVGSLAGSRLQLRASMIGWQHLAGTALALGAAVLSRNSVVLSLATLLGAGLTAVSAVRMAILRGDAPAMAVGLVVVAVGAGVVLPWGAGWQAALVLLIVAVVAVSAQWFGVAMSLLLTLFFMLLVGVSIYIAHLAAASRRELSRLRLELEEAARLADHRRRSLATRIREQTRDLEAAAEELAGFCHAASHDIRPPLRTMAGYAEILAEQFDEGGEDAAREAVAEVVPLAKRMGRRIDDLLDGVRSTHRSLGGSLLPLGDLLREQSALHPVGGRVLPVVCAPGLYADSLGAVAGDLVRALLGYASDAAPAMDAREWRLEARPDLAGYSLVLAGASLPDEEADLLAGCLGGDLQGQAIPERLRPLSEAARAWRAEHGEAARIGTSVEDLEFHFGVGAGRPASAEVAT